MEFKGTKGEWVYKESERIENCFDIWGMLHKVGELSYSFF